MLVAKRFKQFRRKLGVTQDELAKTIKVPVTTISKYERKISRPSLAVLDRIGRSYLINLNWLISGSGDMFLTQQPIIDDLKKTIEILTTQNEKLETELGQSLKQIVDLQEKLLNLV